MLMKATDSNSVLVYDPRGVVESASVPIAARPSTVSVSGFSTTQNGTQTRSFVHQWRRSKRP
jgi:hypothetical protein